MPKITLRAARVNKNLKQSEVAKLLNINNKTLQRWEKGETFPNPIQIDSLCKLYDVAYDDIVFLKQGSL